MKIASVYGLRYASPKTAESTILYHLKRNGIVRRDPADHVRKVSPEMVEGWIRRYQNGESLRQIAEGKVDAVTVWNHLKVRGVVLRDKVEAQIKTVTKYERRPFQGDEAEKAYLLGLRYGDLNVVKHGRAVRVRVSTTHPAMAELFESLFAPYGHVFRYARRARLTRYEWSLECDLDSTFGFLVQKITLMELKELPTSQFIEFAAGLFDAEGTICLHRKENGSTFEVSISNTETGLIDILDERVKAMGYHPRLEMRTQDELRLGYPKSGEISVLRLSRQSEICRFLASLPLRHGEKTDKARFVIERVCDDNFGVGQDVLLDWESLVASVKERRDEFVLQAGVNCGSLHPPRDVEYERTASFP